MSLQLLALIILLSASGGLAIGGALMSLIGWFSIIILLVLIWEYKVYIFLAIFFIIAIKLIKSAISDYLKYKDETEKQKDERLKTIRMIKEWRKRNNF